MRIKPPSSYEQLLLNNRLWVAEKLELDANYFKRLEEGQSPSYLFLGCSDSRVPAETITGAAPGEMFVHRNIANQAMPNDINTMAVLQYAVEVLKVRHVIVCGHYGCGGVRAAMDGGQTGLLDAWLSHIRDVQNRYADELVGRSDEEQQRRLVELNVMAQVRNVASTSLVQTALRQGEELLLHGWVFDIGNGIIRELDVKAESNSAPESAKVSS